jgi:hypothetical protein
MKKGCGVEPSITCSHPSGRGRKNLHVAPPSRECTACHLHLASFVHPTTPSTPSATTHPLAVNGWIVIACSATCTLRTQAMCTHVHTYAPSAPSAHRSAPTASSHSKAPHTVVQSKRENANAFGKTPPPSRSIHFQATLAQMPANVNGGMVYAPSNWNSRPCDLCTVILWPQRCIRRPTGSRSPRPPEVADAPPCRALSPLRHCLVVRWWADRGCIRQRVVGNRLQAPVVQPARSPFTLLPLCGTEEGQIDESQKTHAIQALNTKTSANILRRWTRPLYYALINRVNKWMGTETMVITVSLHRCVPPARHRRTRALPPPSFPRPHPHHHSIDLDLRKQHSAVLVSS